MEKLHHHGGDLAHKGRVDVKTDMTKNDEERLYKLIANHVHHTGSTRGQDILDNWSDYRPKFRKVMPVEYRRALQEMENARNGFSVEPEISDSLKHKMVILVLNDTECFQNSLVSNG